MVGWHHQLYRHEFEQALGVSDGQGSLVCYSPWCRKESNMTEQLNWTGLSEMQFQSINQSSNQFNLNKNKDNVSKAEKMPKYIYYRKFRILNLYVKSFTIYWVFFEKRVCTQDTGLKCFNKLLTRDTLLCPLLLEYYWPEIYQYSIP